jgi:hypothetical protein
MVSLSKFKFYFVEKKRAPLIGLKRLYARKPVALSYYSAAALRHNSLCVRALCNPRDRASLNFKSGYFTLTMCDWWVRLIVISKGEPITLLVDLASTPTQ